MRVILDSSLRTPVDAKLFETQAEALIFIVDSAGVESEGIEALTARGAQIEALPADQGSLDLQAVLRRLAELEVNEVLVEAGATLAGTLLAGSWVDELLLYIAPKLLGPQGRALVDMPELQSLQEAWGFSVLDVERFGEDVRLRLRPRAEE
jgi:diaminohydroxyphosphoribosylaminopyrimidine deaminase/5-amino-6-(5-phosphoribosylamino)uracil reductase